MYHTPAGDRVLTGAEGRLFRAGLYECSLYFDMYSIHDWEPEVAHFRVLDFGQQLALLVQVGEALLREDVEKPRLNSAIESAAAVVYATIHDQVLVELDEARFPQDEPLCYYRPLVRAAMEECGEKGPPDSNIDPEDWEICLEVLTDRVLWDDDFDLFPIAHGRRRAPTAVRKKLGIPADYYDHDTPDIPKSQWPKYVAILRELAGDPFGPEG